MEPSHRPQKRRRKVLRKKRRQVLRKKRRQVVSVPPPFADVALYHSDRHPLQGLHLEATSPPDSWPSEAVQALHFPRWVSEVPSTDDIAHLGLGNLWGESEATLEAAHPWRCFAAWRVVRHRMRILFPETATSRIDRLDPVKDVPRLLPPYPQPDQFPLPPDYDPFADDQLVQFCQITLQATRELNIQGSGSVEAPNRASYQLCGLYNPHFARAAWPTQFELMAAELGAIKAINEIHHEHGPANVQHALLHEYGMGPRESAHLVEVAHAHLLERYEIPIETQRAIVADQLEDFARRARDGQDPFMGELQALKAKAVVVGVGKDQGDASIQDLVESLLLDQSKPVEAEYEHLLPDPAQDPLLLEGEDA